MIPILIAPVINRFDLLERMLRSIDHPVGSVLVVDNSCSGYEVPSDIEVPIQYLRPVNPIGYGGAINQGIMQNSHLMWWMWSSNDVVWHPGALAELDAAMTGHTPARIVTGGFTWGALNHDLVNKVGLVDEWSFFPIYYDDNDYHYRCTLAGVEWVEWWDKGTDHGESGKASMTINSSPALMNKNHSSFTENTNRYLAKWGGMPGKEVFKSPWDSGMPVWVTKPDITGRAQRLW